MRRELSTSASTRRDRSSNGGGGSRSIPTSSGATKTGENQLFCFMYSRMMGKKTMVSLALQFREEEKDLWEFAATVPFSIVQVRKVVDAVGTLEKAKELIEFALSRNLTLDAVIWLTKLKDREEISLEQIRGHVE